MLVRYWEGSVCRSMIHTQQCPPVPYCGIFHSQNTFVCICVRYNFVLFAVLSSLIFWVAHLLNQNNTTSHCKIWNWLLFWKIFKLAPAQCAHWITYQLLSHCCPLLPLITRTVLLPILLSYVSICMTETGTVRYWLLCNMAVLLITVCSAVY